MRNIQGIYTGGGKVSERESLAVGNLDFVAATFESTLIPLDPPQAFQACLNFFLSAEARGGKEKLDFNDK